ncbi:MAG: endopeptidase La [Fimbriimonadaceae bacterium]
MARKKKQTEEKVDLTQEDAFRQPDEIFGEEQAVESLQQEPGFQTEIPEVLSILPLRDSVVFPMLIAPLHVARESSVQLIDESVVGNNRVIGVVAQRNPGVENPGLEDIYPIGCAVIIRTLIKTHEGTKLIVQGLKRFEIVEAVSTSPYLKVKVRPIPESSDEGDSEELEAMRRSVGALFDQAIRLTPLPEELHSLTTSIREEGVMADMVSAHMMFSTEDKQKLLEAADVRERLRLLLELLSKEVRVLELTSRVQSEVNTELSKSQRDYYLREQLKAIQRELGETDDRSEDISALRQSLSEAALPEEAFKEVEREIERLERMSPGSPEYTVARTYVDLMLALPWANSTTDNLELGPVREVLDRDHYGLKKIKDRIIEFLAVRKLKKDGKIRQPILCLVGPPGVGKTSLGKSVAGAMERKFVRISLGGMRDEAEIRGHRRTYIGALPGQIIQGIKRAGTNNPVFVLDEIDKLGSDFRGDPSSALLEVLDPEQNDSFRDHYVDAPFDLSNVFFMTTANRLDTIPAPLRDRMEIIELAGYTEDEKVQIAIQHLLPKQIEEHGLRPSQIVFEETSIRKLVREYTREAGVRELERQVAGVIRRGALQFAEGRKAKLKVTPKFVETALGSPRYLREEVFERELRPGVALGLVYTPVGGDVAFVETAAMPGKLNLRVTGRIGEVMKESVEAALTYLRSHAKQLGISEEKLAESDLHVHVPEGAVPKDGPSAGIAMLTALTSLLTNRKVRPRLAMTGEITLTGQVLPVGGIKEKVLGGFRAGVETFILPHDNQKDFKEDIPPEIQEQLKVHFVDHADQVLKLALEPVSKASDSGKNGSRTPAKSKSPRQKAGKASLA